MRELMATRGPAAATLVLIVAPVVLAAEGVPARVLQAQYVVLGYDLGDRPLRHHQRRREYRRHFK